MVKFNGWLYQPKKWVQWVDSLHSTYASVWRNCSESGSKVGIYKAIMSIKCNLFRNKDLIFGIAEMGFLVIVLFWEVGEEDGEDGV
ncbi:serine/threonine-protein phosphatase [Senna tora]|uniref:Serine/threonine-protein phosphatase n=1 Tax=Senna tora TaxID=362788 RepID=A0A834X123_9FABA|nr:serine/threonine-protein phosphatase [Senna tora]